MIHIETQHHPVIVQIQRTNYCSAGGACKGDCFHLGPVSLRIYAGELLSILGPSGSGKTTLLRLIAGLEKAREGTMTIGGTTVFDHGIFVPPERRKVGMVFQDHALFPHLSAHDNVIFGIRHYSKENQKRRLEELANLLGLNNYFHRYPHELSGGQQQRVALARSLAQSPKVILLDEPLSNIDADLRRNLAQELRSVIKQTGTTAVWVTHDQAEALDLADRIVVLNNGKIEQIDTPWNLYNAPKTRFVADFIGHAVFIKGEAQDDQHIITEVGTIPALPCLKDSKRFEVMIRPDDVKASLNEDGIGTVYKRQFIGPIQTYSIRLPSGQHILTNQPAHIDWPIGTRLQVTLDIKSVIAFPVD